ncbi:MAG: hypothetical protein K8T89_21760 [Planctomycetes bacterium]|nr:hypothetical protein [Planctomycetota bacterium]
MSILFPILLATSFAATEVPPQTVFPEGHVRFTIKVDKNGNANFQPGSKVDIFLVEKEEGAKAKSSTIKENVLIVACYLDRTEKLITSFTVAVKPEDLKILAAAEKRGELRMVLTKP